MATIVIPLPVMRVPSQRDQQIFAQVEGLGRLQIEVAAEFGVTQSRVSQICKRVAAWRARARPRETGELSRREQAQLDRYLDRLRLEETFKLSMREFHKSSQPLVTVRERVKGGEVEFIETTTRQRAANVQCLKTAMKSQEQLGKLSERELPVDSAEDSGKDLEWFKLQDLLKWARLRVENEGRVKPCGDPDALAAHALGIVFGEDVQFEPRTELVRIRKRPPGAKPTRHDLEREEWERREQESGDRSQGPGVRSQNESSSSSPSPSPPSAEQLPHSNAARPACGASGPQGSGPQAADISEMQPGAHKVNTPKYVSEYALMPEERIRQLEALCAAGSCVTEADRRILRKELEAERKKLANISGERGDRGQETRDRGQSNSSSSSTSSSTSKQLGPHSNAARPARGASGPQAQPQARPRPRVSDYAPPLDLGHRPSVPSKEWLEGERERRRECLKALVAVVTETGGE